MNAFVKYLVSEKQEIRRGDIVDRVQETRYSQLNRPILIKEEYEYSYRFLTRNQNIFFTSFTSNSSKARLKFAGKVGAALFTTL
jgi:hypothetical protein